MRRSAWWLPVRRSAMWPWLPLLVFAATLVTFIRGSAWVGSWPATSAAAGLGVFFLAPTSAAAVCAIESRLWTPALAERAWASPRRWGAVHLPWLVASLAVPLLAYLGVAAAMALWTLTAPAGDGGPWPAYLALGAAWLTICVSVGLLGGRLFPASVFVPITLGLVVLMLNGLVRLPLQGLASQTPNTSAVALFTAAAVVSVLAVGLVRPAPLRRLRHAGARTAAGLALAVAAVALVVSPLPRPLTLARAAVEPACAAPGEVLVCVWPENRHRLPALASGVTRMAGAATGLFPIPVVMLEDGLPEPDGDADVVRFDSDDPYFALGAFSMAAVGGAVALAGPHGSDCLPSPQDSAEFSHAVFLLDAWLNRVGYGSPRPADISDTSGIEQADVEALVALSQRQQRRWASGRLDRVAALCQR